MDVNLVVVEGKPLGAVIPLKAERFVIGRDPGCQLRPKSEAVGARQCAILREGGRVTVCDLGSAQGTFVNGRCLRKGDEVRVRDGDRLQVGQLIFAIQVDAEPSDSSEGGGGVEEWLSAPAPNQGAHARRNASSTLTSPAAIAVAAPRAKAEAAPVAPFSYTSYDEARRVACLGLAQAQVADESAVRALRQELLAMASRPQQRRIVADLSGVDDLPSPAVALLKMLAGRCERAGGELRLCGAPDPLERRLEALKFESVVAWYPDQQAALDDDWD